MGVALVAAVMVIWLLVVRVAAPLRTIVILRFLVMTASPGLSCEGKKSESSCELSEHCFDYI